MELRGNAHPQVVQGLSDRHAQAQSQQLEHRFGALGAGAYSYHHAVVRVILYVLVERLGLADPGIAGHKGKSALELSVPHSLVYQRGDGSRSVLDLGVGFGRCLLIFEVGVDLLKLVIPVAGVIPLAYLRQRRAGDSYTFAEF